MTVLFADVTGYTGLGEKLDAERLKEIMDAYFVAMREAIEAEGGTVEKFIGDAVMAVFGAPVSHEDDPARALRAALGMRKRMEALNETLRRSHDVTLEMRIGVNSGEVMAIADPSRGMGMVTGDPVSVAARLEQNAEPGEVLVAERVARATRGFTFAEVGPLALKGKGHAVRALRLTGEQRLAAERGIPGLRAPLVGRDSEMDLLGSLFKRVADERRPHLVTIYGDPGVGKSRLVAEFMQRVEGGGHGNPLILAGRCLPYGDGVTYWPLAEILKGLAGVLDTDATDLVVEKIRKLGRELLTADVAAEPARATAALAYTVGVEDPAVPFRDLSPRQVRLEIHAAWRSLFSGLAIERPVVVLVEDIHWADSALLDLLEELADRLQGPVLLVCPARPELTQRRATWGGGRRNFSSIFLDPLSHDEAGKLIEFLLSVQDLPADVNERILERAEGNPFFLEEIIRQLIDEGMIVHEEGRWKGTAECGEVVIPDTVQGVLAARIDLLPRDEKRVAQSAAVVGRVFWTGPLRRLIRDIDDIDAVLDSLESKELIRARLSSSIGGDREFIFKHVLTRDVAYESLPKRDRSVAHGTVAAWLEQTAGERRREFAELLAYHFAEAVKGSARLDGQDAEMLRKSAVEHLLLASEVARDRYVIDGSRRHAEEALSLATNGSERSKALELIGFAYQYDYQGDDAWRVLRQAVDEALEATPDDHRRIASVCAWALDTPLRYPGSMREPPSEDEAFRYLQAGIAACEHIEGDSPELVRILTAKSFWPYGFPVSVSKEDSGHALEDGLRAAEMARRLGQIRLESAALDGAATSPMEQGLYREANEIHRRRLKLTEELRDPWELGDIFAMQGWMAYMMGRYRETVQACERGMERAVADVPGVAVHIVSWRALARFRLGEWDECLADVTLMEELLGARRRTPPFFGSRPFAAAALIHEIRGNAAAADTLISMLTNLEVEHNETGLTAWVSDLGPLLIRRGDTERAFEVATKALAVVRWRVWRKMNYEALCEALPAAGRWDLIPERAEEMRTYAERGGFDALPFAVDRLEGQLALHEGDQERAVGFFRRSAEGYTSLEAVWAAALSNLLLGETLIGLGRREDATELLHRALETFERLGAISERTRTRELLTRMG